MILISSEPRSAYQKLATEKPSIKEAAKMKRTALITRVKSPRVSNVIGNVSSTKTGLTTALRIPRITAAIRAV